MLNYMKSECYRVIHGKELYVLTGALSGLTVLMNVILYLFNRFVFDFPYGSIRYSLNILSSSMTTLLLGGLLVTSFMFSEEHKNGTLKNAVSFGISRGQFFTAKCIVCSAASLACMAVVLTVYYGSAYLLLDDPGGITVMVRLRGVAANLPMAFAAVILTVALMCMIKKEILMTICWMAVIWLIPTICFFAGFKIEWLNRAAEWMPWNYLKYETAVNMTQYECLWDTPEGLAKCLIAGAIGIAVFYVAGYVAFRKRDIA